MLEFKRSEIIARIYGEDYKLTKPQLHEVEEIAKSKKGSDIEKLTTFLVQRGLPVDVVKTMEMDHILELIDYLSGSKKK